jgi:hypothetical protein
VRVVIHFDLKNEFVCPVTYQTYRVNFKHPKAMDEFNFVWREVHIKPLNKQFLRGSVFRLIGAASGLLRDSVDQIS